MDKLTKKGILRLIQQGRFEIRATGFGMLNNTAEVFAACHGDMIKAEDITVEGKKINVSCKKIIKAFTQNWAAYDGKGALTLELW